MQTDKILSAELLEKYQQGKLQPEEMQQVEKAMLQNPFLTETVEGIALSKNSFAEEVENLKKQMPYYIENHKENHKKNNKGKLFKSSNHQEIYRLAAVILLLLTTSFMLWFFSKSSQEKSTNMSYEIAQKEHNLSENSPASPQATTADLQEKMPEKITTEVSKPIIKPIVKQDKEKDEKPSKIIVNEREEAPILHDKIITQSDDNQEVVAEKSANKPMNESTSTMPDLNHSLAKINSQKEQVESEKQAKIISKDSNTDNSASNVRANAGVSSEEDLKKSADKNIADDEIMGKQAGKSKAKKTSEIASPEMGWEQYQIYLDNNLNRKVAGGKKGKVIAEIIINEKGMITNINILQSLCELCDAEVKRLLLAGGKWKIQTVKKSEKTEIIIIF
jgi:hypothetical protein